MSRRAAAAAARAAACAARVAREQAARMRSLSAETGERSVHVRKVPVEFAESHSSVRAVLTSSAPPRVT